MYENHASERNTESRNSAERTKNNISVWQWMKATMCPCLIIRNFAEENSSQTLSRSDKARQSFLSHDKARKYSFQFQQKKNSQQTDDASIDHYPTGHCYSLYNPRFKRSEVFISAHERAQRFNVEEDAQFMTKSTIKKWHSYPIYHHKENELSVLGTTKGRMLAVICCVKVEPSVAVRKKTSKANSPYKMERSYSSSNIDIFWDQRYYFFEKFDEGISLDNESWRSVIPEAIAEYIANKIRCETVLDAFSGAGGNTIKFANTCSRVIANDIDCRKLKCLDINTKVYCSENVEIMNKNFLCVEDVEADVVFINPDVSNFERSVKNNCLDPSDFTPSLDKSIAKAITLSKNIVFLFPANINVTKLCEIIANEYMRAKICTNTCSIKIQKIFFMSQLKYLAVYFGPEVQHEIKLNDELCYIYNLLKDGEKKVFKHRKIIKKIREQYGMIGLLNYVLESQKIEKNSMIEKFYTYIRQEGLIPEEKLDKIIIEQNMEIQKNSKKRIPFIDDPEDEIMEEEKYVASEEDDKTVSYYSMGSGLNRFSVQARESSDCQTDPIEIRNSEETENKSEIKYRETVKILKKEEKSAIEGECEKKKRGLTDYHES